MKLALHATREPLAKLGLSALLVAGVLPTMGLAAPAARMEFVVGDVQIVAPGGQARPGRKGAEVGSGETVNTNRGRAQLRFSDGAYVSLQPQSEFRIDDYRFEGKADGSERGFFSLLKGGLRTVTGLVGRTHRGNYQVTTAVATIGIRGTEYTIAYTHSITGWIGEGGVNVCNSTGCTPFTSGESFFVPNGDTAPQLSAKKTDLPPPQPENVAGGSFGDQNNPQDNPGQSVHVAGNEVTSAGADDEGRPEYKWERSSTELPGTQPPSTKPPSTQPPTQPPSTLTGRQQLDGVYASGFGTGYFQPGTVVLDGNGVVTDFNGIVPIGPGVQTGNDGVVAWGYFPRQISAVMDMLAFVTGSPVTNFGDLNAGSKIATYTLLPGGGTPVLDPATGATIGTLSSASMTVNFGALNATAQMAWSIQAGSYAAALSGSFDGPLYLNGSCSVGTCSVSALGQVFGANATRSGIAYQFSSGSTTGVGSAALGQTSLQP